MTIVVCWWFDSYAVRPEGVKNGGITYIPTLVTKGPDSGYCPKPAEIILIVIVKTMELQEVAGKVLKNIGITITDRGERHPWSSK